MNLSSQVREEMIEMLDRKYKDHDYFDLHYKKVDEKLIGKGGAGKVHHVRQRDAENEFAVKEITLKYDEIYTDETTTSISANDTTRILSFVQCCQEAILQSKVFRHKNIVQVHEVWLQPSSGSVEGEKQRYADSILTIIDFLSKLGSGAESTMIQLTPDVRQALVETEGLMLYLAMDKYDMDLKAWLGLERRAKTIEKRDRIIYDIMDALNYIHNLKSYCHLDLKPSNILIIDTFEDGNSTTKASVTDFGLSIYHEVPLIAITDSYRPGTIPYNLAPDPYLSDKYDMWAFGLILYQLLNSKNATSHELTPLVRHAKDTANRNMLTEFLQKHLDNNNWEEFGTVLMQCFASSQERVSSQKLFKRYIASYIPTSLLDFPSDTENSPEDTDMEPITDDFHDIVLE